MKNFTRKLFPLAAAFGLVLAASAAQATPFNVLNGSGGMINAGTNELDWSSSGSGLAIGIGPFGAPLTVGQEFNFVYQSDLAGYTGGVKSFPLGFQLDNQANGGPDNPFTAYEFTIVAKLREVVTTVTNNAGGGQTVTFGLAAGDPSRNKVAIYYDTAQNASHDAGTGFDDGTRVALLTIVAPGSTSAFTLTSPSTGQGAAELNAAIVLPGDIIDQNYLQGLTGLLFNMNFQSTLNYPAPVADRNVAAFHVGGDPLFLAQTVGSNDILFKVDGFNSFGVNAVPEPASMMLMGLGLIGVVGATRRRKQVKG